MISPEGCAAILWKDGARAPDAAEQLKLTAGELKKLGVVDDIIPEPAGGAHRQLEETTSRVKTAIVKHLRELMTLDEQSLANHRYEKFRKLGQIIEKCNPQKLKSRMKAFIFRWSHPRSHLYASFY